MAICSACGRDPKRGVRPLGRLSRPTRSSELPAGAGQISVDVGADRRAAMNRIAAERGLSIAELVRRALDVYLPSHAGEVE